MPLQTLGAKVGVAKQSSRGTLATNPTFAHGVSGGSPISVEPSQKAMEVTSGKRVAATVMRDGVKTSAEVQSPFYLETGGLFLLGALGTEVVTGTEAPYTHTYATGDLPYLSFFATGIGSTHEAVRDCKVDELSLKWDGAKPLNLSVKASGTVFSYPSTFTPTTDETGSDKFFVPVGGTFSVDVVGSSPVSARVVAGEIMVKNNVSTIDGSASIESLDVSDGLQEHTVKLTIVPDDLSDFRKVITGSASGSAVTGAVPYGSLSLQFKENGGTHTLTVTGAKVAFLTKFPDVSTKGDVIKLELAGEAVLASGGTAPLVFALTNTTASY